MAILSPIQTARLRIVPFETRHLSERYIGWLNDPAVVRYSEQRHRRHDRASCQAYVERIARSDSYFCAVEETERGLGHVGNITVAVDTPNGLADIAILLGDSAIWGNGIGFEAWAAMLTRLLTGEGFRKVTGGTVEANRAMVRIMEKAAMQPDGRRTAHHLIDGQAMDVVYYAAFPARNHRT